MNYSEADKLKCAKIYIDKLIQGVDPITKGALTVQTLQNERLIACLRYVSEQLKQRLAPPAETRRDKSPP